MIGLDSNTVENLHSGGFNCISDCFIGSTASMSNIRSRNFIKLIITVWIIFSHISLQLFESGIVWKYYDKYVPYAEVTAEDLAEVQRNDVPLVFMHFALTCIILVASLTIATIVFLTELLKLNAKVK